MEKNLTIERLEQLATHLETGKLGHQIFDIRHFNKNRINDNSESYYNPGPKCGTNGCAIGECPILWPKDWIFSDVGYPELINSLGTDVSGDAMKWFNISYSIYRYLFIPYRKDEDGEYAKPIHIERYSMRRLPETATKEQVAANIRSFVKQFKAKNHE